MWPILRAWANPIRAVKLAAVHAALLSFVLLGFSNVFAQEEIPAQESSIDSLLKFEQVEPETVADTIESIEAALSSSSEEILILPSSSSKGDAPLKTVLYLGGGDRSPWFHLGVLYAIEEFGIPVDSIVATSWGAWVGSLWAKGVSPDEIQRMLLDSTVAPYVGRNLSGEQEGQNKNSGVDPTSWPLSESGIPSLRKRLVVTNRHENGLEAKWKKLSPDSTGVQRSLVKLRLQESLYRQSVQFVRPFSLQRCDENANLDLQPVTVENIMNSLPLWDAAGALGTSRMTGELCPFNALPAEDHPDELSIIVVASPLRNPAQVSAKEALLRQVYADRLKNQPGLIIRAHAIQDTARNAWIQAGFSAMEQRRTAYGELSKRKVDYGANRKSPAKPWFRFSLSMDSLSPAIHSSVKTYWAESDTGMAAPQNFTARLLKNPAYDSLKFSMSSNGDLMVDAVSDPVFDFAAGGFGSTALGPNAYFEGSAHFVDHVEMQLVLAGFVGINSYGIQPKLEISKLWSLHWGVIFGYDFLKLQPMKSFNNSIPRSQRADYEERRDLNMTMYYQVDNRQRVSAEFLFGHRIYALDTILFDSDQIKTFPVAPTLHYAYSTSDNMDWFSTNGLGVDVMAGMESIGFNFGVVDLVPIYWKLLLDSRFAYSPKPFLSFSAGIAGGMERYHEDGYGYVYPKAFDYRPLDLIYRLHAAATPWTTEWYNPELSSHEYGMVRASGGLHGKYVGVWIFGAYYHDFENSPLAKLGVDKVVLEPSIRLAYKSLSIYMGMNRIVDSESLKDLLKLDDYEYFIRVGNYSF